MLRNKATRLSGCHRRLLLPKQIPDTCERETQFRIRPGPDLGGDDVSCRERSPRGIGTRRKVFRFDSAAQENAKAHLVGHGA